jgi:integrase
MFNFARSRGLTNKTNPCAGVDGFPEPGRDHYVDDDVFFAVWDCADQGLQDAMDLAYLTAQRKSDVLKMSQDHVRKGEMNVQQGKTGMKVRLEVIGQFATVMARINSRKVMGLGLVNRSDGTQMTKYMLRTRFDNARDLACEASQLAAECAGLPDISASIRKFQFRDLRAKAGTDTEELRGMAAAKDQLGHSSEAMTAHYVRHRRGKLVKPTK